MIPVQCTMLCLLTNTFISSYVSPFANHTTFQICQQEAFVYFREYDQYIGYIDLILVTSNEIDSFFLYGGY